MGIFDRLFGKRQPLRATAGRVSPSAKYEEVDADQARQFLDEGLAIQVHSSCIRWVQFDKEAKTFLVEWFDPATGKASPWLYTGVNVDIARAFLAAGSKGSFCSLTFTHAKWPGHPA